MDGVGCDVIREGLKKICGGKGDTAAGGATD